MQNPAFSKQGFFYVYGFASAYYMSKLEIDK